jgi:hypothetical protein
MSDRRNYVMIKCFYKVVKEKVMAGLKLTKVEIRNNFDRMIPVDIVEARKTVAYMDDDF